MNTLTAIAALLALAAFAVLWQGLRARMVRGFAPGTTVALDDRVLFSRRLMLVGRPDRIVHHHGMPIPEEWKSARRVYPGHRLQLGVYFLLIEDVLGTRPPHGFVVLGSGTRVKVENTEALRSEVLAIADRIRAHRMNLTEPIPVSPGPPKCRACGQRPSCGQAQA